MGIELTKSLQWHEGNKNNSYSNLILYFYICALTLAVKAEDLQYNVCARNASILFSTLAEKIPPLTCHVILYALNAKVVFFFSCAGVCKVALMHLEPAATWREVVVLDKMPNLSDYRIDFLYLGVLDSFQDARGIGFHSLFGHTGRFLFSFIPGEVCSLLAHLLVGSMPEQEMH